MLRRLLARFIIRRVWRLGKDWPALEIADKVQRHSTVLNIASLISTVLGGNSSWMPEDVVSDFKSILIEKGVRT